MKKYWFAVIIISMAIISTVSCKKQDPPSAGMSVQSTAYLLEEIICNATCENATSVMWDFGDGSSPSSGTTVKHTYTKGGYYNLRITAQNEAGKDIYSSFLYVKNGKAEYNVTNNTSAEISFYVYGVNGNMETEEFKDLGPVKSGKTSGIELTNQATVFLAGSTGNLIFYSVYPNLITDFTLNKLGMYDTTTVYIQGDKPVGIRQNDKKLHLRELLDSDYQNR
jgi:PKD repeat protein